MVVARSPPRQPATSGKTLDGSHRTVLKVGSSEVASKDAEEVLALSNQSAVPQRGIQSSANRRHLLSWEQALAKSLPNTEVLLPGSYLPAREASEQRDSMGTSEEDVLQCEGSDSDIQQQHFQHSSELQPSFETESSSEEKNELSLLELKGQGQEQLERRGAERSKSPNYPECAATSSDTSIVVEKPSHQYNRSLTKPSTNSASSQSDKPAAGASAALQVARQSVDRPSHRVMHESSTESSDVYTEAVKEVGNELNLDGAIASEEAFQKHFETNIAMDLEHALNLQVERGLFNRYIESEARIMQLISKMDHMLCKAKRVAKADSRSAKLRVEAARSTLKKSEELFEEVRSHACQDGGYEKKLRGSEERSAQAEIRRNEIRETLLECTRVRCKVDQLRLHLKDNKDKEQQQAEAAHRYRDILAAFTRVSFSQSREYEEICDVLSSNDRIEQRRVLEYDISVLPCKASSRENEHPRELLRHLSLSQENGSENVMEFSDASDRSTAGKLAALPRLKGDVGTPRLAKVRLCVGDEAENKEPRDQIWRWIEEAALPPYKWVSSALDRAVLNDDAGLL